MSKVRISAVSYTNTKPFAYGIEHSGILDKIDLSYDIPSECAAKLINNQVDIGLIPVASLLDIPDFHILGDYCIGSEGAVNSVFIFSDKPIEQIEKIRLDPQSRTSNNLAKVLVKNYWKIDPEFIVEGEADAFVEIGDRTFGKKSNYTYFYDLGEHWFNFTNLPFAFAVWASNKVIDENFVTEFNLALKLGIDNRNLVLAELKQYKNFDLQDYFYNKLSFDLDDDKRSAISTFHNFIKKL